MKIFQITIRYVHTFAINDHNLIMIIHVLQQTGKNICERLSPVGIMGSPSTPSYLSAVMFGGFEGGPQLGPHSAESRQSLNSCASGGIFSPGTFHLFTSMFQWFVYQSIFGNSFKNWPKNSMLCERLPKTGKTPLL